MASDEHATDRLIGAIEVVPAKRAYHDSVWHYTDAGGLAGIVGGADRAGCLWATAATMLNDPGELKYGARQLGDWFDEHGDAVSTGGGVREVIRSVVKDLENSVLSNPAYVVCASTDGDSLGQWRGYAGAGGYAVELGTWDEYATADKPDPSSSFSVAPSWVKVAYQQEEQEALIRDVFDDLLGDGQIGRAVAGSDHVAEVIVRGRLSGLAAALKHPSFAEEKEVRLISFLPPGVAPRIRTNSRGVIPYIELNAAIFPNVLHPMHPARLQVRSVRVGPPSGEARAQRIQGVKTLLASAGRSDVPVYESDIPFIP